MRLNVLRHYHPDPYEGEITLFRARETDASIHKVTHDANPTYGWERLAHGGTEIVDVPGTHASLMFPPHIRNLTRSLREKLTRAECAVTSGSRSNGL
jgi:thioesterase domain-containing protein